MHSFDPKVFGRRLSRPLRTEKKSLYEESLPHLNKPLEGRFWEDIKSPLYLEIGFGGGEHLAQKAFDNSDVQFIGSEPFINGVASLLKHIQEKNIKNILVHDDDIHKLLNRIDQPCIFDRVYLLFADPWPKKRHHKRRFVQDETIKRIHTLLKDGGEWFIATDHVDYRSWILEHFDAYKNLFQQVRPNIYDRPCVNDWPITRYEEKAKREGRFSTYMIYKKI
ncbi:MAG: tRNA (guanine-N(7)-)-methyltransferase [Holosporales bacterium]